MSRTALEEPAGAVTASLRHPGRDALRVRPPSVCPNARTQSRHRRPPQNPRRPQSPRRTHHPPLGIPRPPENHPRPPQRTRRPEKAPRRHSGQTRRSEAIHSQTNRFQTLRRQARGKITVAPPNDSRAGTAENRFHTHHPQETVRNLQRSRHFHECGGKSSRSVCLVRICPWARQKSKSNQPFGSLVQCHARPRSMTFRLFRDLPVIFHCLG